MAPKKNPNWPAYVSEANGRVVYRPRIKGQPPEGYDIDSKGFLKPPIKLGKPTDSDELIMQRHQEALRTLGINPSLTKGKAAEQPGRVYGYARISTDKQDADRQQKDIFEYAAKHKMLAPEIVTETISSRNGDRQVFALIDRLEKNDVLIVTELSRLARSMVEMNGIVADVVKKGAAIHVAAPEKEMVLDSSMDIKSQCMLFALGLASQLEREMISERTKSGLKAARAEGVRLGRPKGKGRKVDDALKAKGLESSYIADMSKAGLSVAKIAKLMDLDARTVAAWLATSVREIKP